MPKMCRVSFTMDPAPLFIGNLNQLSSLGYKWVFKGIFKYNGKSNFLSIVGKA